MPRDEPSGGGPTQLDAVDARLIDHLHEGFPLIDRPFEQVGQALGLPESEVIERLRRLLAQGTLTRFGPMFQIEKAGGAFVLAAMEVPADRFERVAEIVNDLPEVAHNYRRDHRLNMWFVVAADTQGQAQRALRQIEQATGLPVLAFPKEREYFVGLRFRAQPPENGHGVG